MVCPRCKSENFKKNGSYTSKSHRQKLVQRYYCRGCESTFSDQTGTLTCGERKPYATQLVMRLLMSGVSQRRCAKIADLHPITVARKLERLGLRAAARNLEESTLDSIEEVIFDEMETFEHTKCKPVSIPLAVEKQSRRIIAIGVASMPAKGKLAKISRAKYGARDDDRKEALAQVLECVKNAAPGIKVIKSDMCPRYPNIVKKTFGSQVSHLTYKGRRGCIVGQGELKRGGFDPLFSLNHTCAMVRDNLKRLSRRTWCTTKKRGCLKWMLDLYVWCHNQLLHGADWGMALA